MGKDCRNEFLREVEERILDRLSPEDVQAIMDDVTIALSEYEITERCTKIAVKDDFNAKIMNQYLSCMVLNGRSEKTIAAYRWQLKKLCDFFGDMRVTDIGVYELRYYLACEKNRGISNRTLNGVRCRLSSFFQWMVDEDYLIKNPFKSITTIKYTKEIKIPFSAIDIDKMRHSCKDIKERALIEFLLATGVRVSELSEMNVEDVDFGKMKVIVHKGKGDKERIVYMNDFAKLSLQTYLFTRKEAGNALFYNRNGERLKPGGIRVILHNIGNRAEVDNVHPHRFRRTLATTLSNRGMKLQEIQLILGHSKVETTLQYITADNEQIYNSYKQHIA